MPEALPPREARAGRQVRFESVTFGYRDNLVLPGLDLDIPAGQTVALVGDFNSWNVGATPLEATERDGIWTVTVPLPAGRHEYAFVVDGVRWMPDPNAPRAGTADFGPANSVVTVTDQT